MGRLEEDVKIESGFIAFEFLKNAGHDGAGKLGLSQVKEKVLVGKEPTGRLATGALPGVSFPLPITIICAGTVMLMVAVKRLRPYAFTGNQRPA